MHAILAVTLLAALAAASTHQGFTVNQVARGKEVRNGPLAYQRALVRYGEAVPAGVAAAATQSGSVVVTGQYNDAFYTLPVDIGTPVQRLYLYTDTGSSDDWTFSTLQPADQIPGHIIYNASRSSTSSLVKGETWDITYADGSGAKGVLYSDKIVVGGVTATSAAVEAATSASSDNIGYDGVFGLAFKYRNHATPNQVDDWFLSVMSMLPQRLFSMYLRKGEPGAIDFGYINATRYNGSITYTNVLNSTGGWYANIQGYSVAAVGYSQPTTCLFDSGNSLLLLPPDFAAKYYAQVDGATNSTGSWVYPCNSSLPYYGTRIEGTYFFIPPSGITYSQLSGNRCFGGIQSSGSTRCSYGDPFFRHHYLIFDESVPRLGYAKSSDVKA